MKKRLAIFISGRGTNMLNIVRAIKSKKIRGAEVALVFSDRSDAEGLEKAERLGVHTAHIDPKKFSSKEAYEKEVVQVLKEKGVDYIILAGYMRIVSPYMTRLFRERIINVHPALLPSFKGKDGIGDAYAYGVKVMGVTIHFVNDELDGGPIILQESISLREGEALESVKKRMHALEYKLYPKAINLLVSGKLQIVGNKVVRL